MYEDQLLSIDKIAEKLGVSGTTIHNHLRAQEVDTTKRLRRVICACGCGKTTKRPRCQVRTGKLLFFNRKHFINFMKGPMAQKYKELRDGKRIGKAVLKACVGILDFDPVIHHIDGTYENNSPKNLLGFRSREDYFLYQKGVKVMALRADTGAWEEVRYEK
jgi:predicted transcriptional regulator